MWETQWCQQTAKDVLRLPGTILSDLFMLKSTLSNTQGDSSIYHSQKMRVSNAEVIAL